MNAHRLTFATFALATFAMLALLAQAAGAAPAESCPRINEDITRTEQQRKEAVEKGESAWKLVVPFAVLARKVSSKSAVEEADRQLVVLRQRAVAEGCTAPSAEAAGDGLVMRCAPPVGIEVVLGNTVFCEALK